MPGDFAEKVGAIQARVGIGNVVGNVVVDQPYAQLQHESLEFRHPHGGQAKYLEEPLHANSAEYLNHLASHIDDPVVAMAENMEHLAGMVAVLAPIELGNLRASGHPIVTDDGIVVYDRPGIPRLPDRVIDAVRGRA